MVTVKHIVQVWYNGFVRYWCFDYSRKLVDVIDCVDGVPQRNTDILYTFDDILPVELFHACTRDKYKYLLRCEYTSQRIYEKLIAEVK